MKKMRIGFFGDGPWSQNALDLLLRDETIEIIFVCARNKEPDSILKKIATRKKITFLHDKNINGKRFEEFLQENTCDLFVSMSFDQIFSQRIIEMVPKGVINCHAGKLPFYRGRNILNWALINDEKDFGITVHFVDRGIDTGDIIIQESFEIKDSDDYSTLLERAYVECPRLLLSAIKRIQNDKVKNLNQAKINKYGSYFVARKEGDEVINWNNNSREIFNFIRAITFPGPVARTKFMDTQIKIFKAEYSNEFPKYRSINGSVVGVDQDSFYVKTADSYLRITKWSDEYTPRIGHRLQ